MFISYFRFAIASLIVLMLVGCGGGGGGGGGGDGDGDLYGVCSDAIQFRMEKYGEHTLVEYNSGALHILEVTYVNPRVLYVYTWSDTSDCDIKYTDYSATENSAPVSFDNRITVTSEDWDTIDNAFSATINFDSDTNVSRITASFSTYVIAEAVVTISAGQNNSYRFRLEQVPYSFSLTTSSGPVIYEIFDVNDNVLSTESGNVFYRFDNGTTRKSIRN